MRLLELAGRTTLVATFALQPLACGTADGTGNADAIISETDSAGVRIVQNLEPRSLLALELGEPTLRIGSRFGEEAEILSNVGGARLLSDRTVVLTDNGSATIRKYDGAGNLLARFGSRGEGPREFQVVIGPWEIGPDSEHQLAVYDPRQQRVTYLGDDLSFRGVTPIRPPSQNRPKVAGILPDSTIVQVETSFTLPETGFDAQASYLVLVRPNGSRDTVLTGSFGRLGPIRFDHGEVMSGPMFEPRFRVGAGRDRIIASECDAPELSVLTPTGAIAMIIRWQASDRAVAEADVAAYREQRLAGLEGEQRRDMNQILSVPPVNEAFPVCDALKVGDDGRLWVKQYERPRDSVQQWWAFDDSGRLMAELTLPRDRQILTFAENRIIVLERDDLGVETVAEYVVR